MITIFVFIFFAGIVALGTIAYIMSWNIPLRPLYLDTWLASIALASCKATVWLIAAFFGSCLAQIELGLLKAWQIDRLTLIDAAAVAVVLVVAAQFAKLRMLGKPLCPTGPERGMQLMDG